MFYTRGVCAYLYFPAYLQVVAMVLGVVVVLYFHFFMLVPFLKRSKKVRSWLSNSSDIMGMLVLDVQQPGCVCDLAFCQAAGRAAQNLASGNVRSWLDPLPEPAACRSLAAWQSF